VEGSFSFIAIVYANEVIAILQVYVRKNRNATIMILEYGHDHEWISIGNGNFINAFNVYASA
jgi:hypothetical protein